MNAISPRQIMCLRCHKTSGEHEAQCWNCRAPMQMALQRQDARLRAALNQSREAREWGGKTAWPMTEPSEVQPDPATIPRPVPHPSGGRQDAMNPFTLELALPTPAVDTATPTQPANRQPDETETE